MQPFTVEFGDDRNSTMVVKILRQKVRGKFSLNQLPRGHNVGTAMGGMPDIPGMCMSVDPQKREIAFLDPLAGEKGKALLQQINAIHNNPNAGPVRTDQKFAPSALHGTTHKLDPDRFKTLVIQTVGMVNEGMATVVKGSLPSAKEIETMIGDELNDVMNSSATKPKFRKDVEAWRQKLETANV